MLFGIWSAGIGKSWKWSSDVGGHYWRTATDIYNQWSGPIESTTPFWQGSGGVLHNFDTAYSIPDIANKTQPGHYTFLDQMVVGVAPGGKSIRGPGLTFHETQAHMSMWVMAASPLLTCNDVRNMSADIKEILTNPEVLAVHKDPLAKMAVRIDVGGGDEESHASNLCASEHSIYGKELADGSSAVMVLNRGEANASMTLLMEDVGDSLHTTYRVRDLWLKANLSGEPAVTRLVVDVPAHGVRLLRLWPMTPAPPPAPLPPPPHPPCPADFAAHTAGYWHNLDPLGGHFSNVSECAVDCRTKKACVAFEVFLGSGYPGQCYNFLNTMSLPFTVADSVTCVKKNKTETPARSPDFNRDWHSPLKSTTPDTPLKNDDDATAQASPTCSMGGVLEPDGRCSCDATWTGKRCQHLNVLPSPKPTCPSITDNTDLPGHNLSWGSDVSTAQACCKRCSDLSTCDAWVYMPFYNRTCYLKSNATSGLRRNAKEGAVMGMRDINSCMSCNNEGSFKQPGASTWGGSPIFAEGRYHIFASEFTGGCGLGTWIPRSHIVHAVSDSMLGPFVKLPPPHGVVIPTFAHNPTIRLHPDGTYLIFFIGAARHNMSAPTNWTLEASISLAFSRSVYGPWQVMRNVLPGRGEESPHFDSDAINPSPIIMADGSVLLLYRGTFRPHGGRGLPCWNRLGAARSKGWRGPFTRISDKPLLPIGQCNEDLVGWQDARGTLHLLAHSMAPQNGQPGYKQQVGHRAYSTDLGDTWRMVNSTPGAYTTSLSWIGGGETTAYTRERPQVLLAQREGGGMEPIVLFTGVVAGPGTTGPAAHCEHKTHGYSWTHAAPVNTSTSALARLTAPNTALKNDDFTTTQSPPACPILQQANVGMRNGTSIGAIKYLGATADCAACQAACQAANRTDAAEGPCRSWVWWFADEQVPGFAHSCHGRFDDFWPPVEHIPRSLHHVCSGANCEHPPSGYRPAPPPGPVGPVIKPTAAQLAWQDREVGAMITFGMQTYGLLPVGTKKKPPPASVFDPDKLDTDVWVSAAKSFGAKYAVLVASHRSGFTLWPTASHNYSLASSPFRNGKADIVQDFIASCRKYDLVPGVFWTQRFNDYFGVANSAIVNASAAVQPVTQTEYNAMMSTQLTELSKYGFEEFWVNGAIDGDAAPQLTKQVARLFPNATCHSCAGVPTPNNIRWVGTGELGFGPLPSWGAVGNLSQKTPGHHGNPHGQVYSPASCDAVLREHCWFGGAAYKSGHCKLSSTANLVRKYLTSVGRNCNLILNIAPDTHGALAADELAAYDAMGKAVTCLFAQPVATTAKALPMNQAGVIEWTLPPTGAACHNCSLVLEEDLTEGQLIGDYSLLCRVGAGSWKPCDLGSLSTDGTPAIPAKLVAGIGHKRILMLKLGSPLLGLRLVVATHFATAGQVPQLRQAVLYDWAAAEGCFQDE